MQKPMRPRPVEPILDEELELARAIERDERNRIERAAEVSRTMGSRIDDAVKRLGED